MDEPSSRSRGTMAGRLQIYADGTIVERCLACEAERGCRPLRFRCVATSSAHSYHDLDPWLPERYGTMVPIAVGLASEAALHGCSSFTPSHPSPHLSLSA